MSCISIGITTRNRHAALARCIGSMRHIVHLQPDIRVFDDGSDEPADATCRAAAPEGIRVDVVRVNENVGNITGRNLLIERASNPYVLLMDDDAFILSAAPVERALAALSGDPRLLAVAFAQADADGQPWPAVMQPGQTDRAAYVPSFIGFAHLNRRDAFLSLGGYRSEFFLHAEEKDLCLRAMDAGWRVLYLPDALMAHVPDPEGRVPERYVRLVMRNDLLFGLYNEPLPMAVGGIAVRLWRYRQMARHHGVSGSLGWILGDVRKQWPSILRKRRPVSWRTIAEWRRLRKNPQPYRAA